MGEKAHALQRASATSDALAPLYGAARALLARDGRWRTILAGHIAPRPHDIIVDFPCGGGDLALQLARLQPAAHIIGVDQDAELIARARVRAAGSRPSVSFVCAAAHETPSLLREMVATKVIVTLTDIHSAAEKLRRLELARTILDPLGSLFVIDHGAQRTSLMRSLNNAARALRDAPSSDGRDTLTPLIRSAGFVAIDESMTWPTTSGSVSMFRARAS